jgi:hypothetical protein
MKAIPATASMIATINSGKKGACHRHQHRRVLGGRGFVDFNELQLRPP